MMELNRFTTCTVGNQRRKQTCAKIDITLRPCRRRRTARFIILSDGRFTFAIEVNAIATFVSNQSLIRIAIGEGLKHVTVIITHLDQTVRSVVLEPLRGTVSTNNP